MVKVLVRRVDRVINLEAATTLREWSTNPKATIDLNISQKPAGECAAGRFWEQNGSGGRLREVVRSGHRAPAGLL